MQDFVERRSYLTQAPVALVIGCGDMGMGTARALGRRDPLVIADIDEARLERAVATLRHEGYTATGHRCDITAAEQVTALGDSFADGPGVRVLAHVAGVGASIGSWRKMMAIDLTGVHLVANAVGPHMVRGGVAILISSLAAYLSKVDAALDTLLDDPLQPGFFDGIVRVHGGEPDFNACYAYAKLGVIRLAEKLAIRWGPQEVRAVTVTPGMIDTSIGRTDGATLPAHDGSGGEVSRGDKVREIPLARQGSILEIAALVEFLASDAAAFINGIDIPVDGGHRAVWRERGVTMR